MKQEKYNSELSSNWQHLPQHEPSDQIWERLEGQLIVEEQLTKLPQHTPPDRVWASIEQAIPSSSKWPYYLAAAVACLLLVGGFYWYKNVTTTTSETDLYEFAYSEEVIYLPPLEEEGNMTDDLTEEQIKIHCQVKLLACSSSSFKKLERELEELEAAKQELQIAMNLVGKNEHLIKQMKEIEVERSAVLKEMMVVVL